MAHSGQLTGSLDSSSSLPVDQMITRLKKAIKMLRDVGIADQQKAGKQGRDDSIKQFSTQLHCWINLIDFIVSMIQLLTVSHYQWYCYRFTKLYLATISHKL